MDPLKFYALEDYLFSEVTAAFRERGYLTPEEFFSIVIWKAERAKSRIKRRLLSRGGDLESTIKTLTEEIHAAPTDRERLKLLLEKWNFRLPMASALLAVLYPKQFTVYDYRARQQLGMKDFAERRDVVDLYFDEYLSKVAELPYAATLRDKDRYLWGKSAYEDLQAFLKGGKA
jgi:hypothetical protein